MKPSFYNFTYPFEDGKKVMYNSRSNALALIDDAKYSQFINYCENATPIEDESLLRDLKAGAYLVDDDIDERDLIRLNMLTARYGTSSLGLTIAPTSDCNFRCIYCYEKDSIKPVTMSVEVQDKLVEFVEQRAKMITSLSVAWYGGEPLLALDIIESLAKRFKEICEKHEISYSHSMITNGYLLTPEIAERLKTLQLSMIQITLDGPPEDHDKRRFLKGNIPTFDKIVSNLREIRDNMPCPVSLRINVDRSNADKVERLLDILRANELQSSVVPYLGMVESVENTYENSVCYHSNEFSTIDFDFKLRYNNDANNFLATLYPRPVRNVCGADSTTGFVIDADGKLYKCWNEIGMEERCAGSLMEAIDGNKRMLLDYILYDPTYDDECKECKFLPICMGGCPSRRLHRNDNRCEKIKYRMDDYMKVLPSLLKRQQESSRAKLEQTGSVHN